MHRFSAKTGPRQRGTSWQLRVVALALAGGSTSLSAGSLQVFGNSTAMTINDNAPASLYPSVINVNTIPGNVITKATVRLIGLSHSWPNDMDIVLVAPDGTHSIVMSDAGGGGTNALSNVNLTFSSTAPTRTPRDTTINSAVSQRPANYAVGSTAADETDTFPGAGPGTLRFDPADFDAFNGVNPNGDWKLYVRDDTTQDTGGISGGWLLLLTVPTVFTVTKTADTNDGVCDGDCSLREAIAAATANVGNDDLIRFASPLFDSAQTITLDGTALSPTENINIQGPGADRLSISGNNLSSVFSNIGNNLSLSGLTVRDGLSSLDGGGIGQNGGAIALRNVAVTGSRAGPGGWAGGVVGIDVIANFVGCTFSDNSAPDFAGAILVQGTTYASLRMVNSTVSGNRSGTGGSVFASSATGVPVELEIVNSTIANNSAPSGGGLFILTQGAGTGTYTATVRNSIVANNTFPNIVRSDIGDGSISLISQGYNLIGDAGAYFDNVDTTSISNANPRLGPLNNNGGQVETLALLAGSPALDKGERSGYANDVRAAPRGFDTPNSDPAATGDSSDIGAVEMRSLIVTNTASTGLGSLRDAITTANLDATQDDILFDDGLFGVVPQVINLAGVLPDITQNLSLNGPGAKLLTVRRDTGGDYRIFNSTGVGRELAMSGLTISDGRTSAGGGGIFSFNRLSLSAVTISGNVDVGILGGGGITLAVADGIIKGSTISSNQTVREGGGILVQGTGDHVVRVIDSTLSGNQARLGGGISVNNPTAGTTVVELINSTVAGNAATNGNGAVDVFTQSDPAAVSIVRVRNSIVANNTLPNLGVGTAGGGVADIVSLGYNLSNDPTPQFLDLASDKFNTNPLLGPLADNGGPTRTHALLAGSPAIDAGDWSGSTTDPRGVARPIDQPGIANAANGGYDIGAVEDDTLFRNGFE